ncbi:hypothetical protein B0H21DRAFT_872070 [Amylocystis lapponica]|nr:hypothetical protein B0H21DRAFT_872070 [Amylocystis lapponica]
MHSRREYRKVHNPQRLQCSICDRWFGNRSGLTQHDNAQHPRVPEQVPRPPQADNADEPYVAPLQHENNPAAPPHRDEPEYLPGDTPPPPRTGAAADDWSPFNNRVEFEAAEFMYTREQMSQGNINTLIDLSAASLLAHRDQPPFANTTDMCYVLDEIKLGDAPWQSFSAKYTGILPEGDPPSWMTAEYQIWCRNPLTAVQNMLSNPDFDGEFDYCPYQEHTRNDDDIITEDPTTHGAMFVPLVLGSDKTTVSVATGHNEYYPLYLSLGNVHNNVRRAHRNAVTVIAFLSIPKSEKKYTKDPHFRKFRRQLFHTSLSAILQPLRPGMTVPEVTRCPDNHYRRVIYGLGPYIADYPEQVLACCIVQGWCATCPARRDNLDDGQDHGRRTRELTDALVAALDLKTLWDGYGIVGDIIPFTNDFPRADICQLICGDLLHQIIKGTFYDHLVTWIGQYLELVHGKTEAAKVMDEIDRRIAAVPAFAGLRRFPEGRNFKQWTGDDSKALMKVYLPAITGLVPVEIVRTLSAFLEFCYLVRRSFLTESMLAEVSAALVRFRLNRKIFQDSGVRETGFSLPRQHSLDHYLRHCRNFAVPNGLCSSITESKHIKAVKEPWRRSNRYNAIGQMLLTNQRLDKLAAARTDFTTRNMLHGTVLSDALEHLDAQASGHNELVDDDSELNEAGEDNHNSSDDDSEHNHAHHSYPRTLEALAAHLGQDELVEQIARFLFDQAHRDDPDAPNADDVPLEACPLFLGRIDVFHSASSTFYAPSDLSGIGGMRRERIRATPSWRAGPGRYDCIFVGKDDSEGFRGLHVARVRLFFSFRFEEVVFPCVLVEWLTAVGDAPDEDTGMWIVEPDFNADGSRTTGVIHLDSVIRAAHLIGVYGESYLPANFTHTDSLDAFAAFYVNKYADHHAHETAF